MPRLNIQALITHLEEIDMNLGIIWEDCKNYDLLDALERERIHIQKILKTLRNLGAGKDGKAWESDSAN